jgi:transcriptional regulator
MYIPHYFKNANLAEVKTFIQQNGFGILINVADGKPMATHIPLELSMDGTKITGHVSRGNPQWKKFESDNNVLCIFTGPHAYVSSSWYNHENTPTWNYIAVHLYGKIRVIEGQELYDSLKHLLDKYEQHSGCPVTIEKMSDEFVKSSMRGIIGFEIAIHEIQASYKLSQNRDDESYQNVVRELSNSNDENARQVAALMKNRRPEKT